ncbi:phosphate ABC transporter permease PstA [Halorubrum distributum]|uniref:phosphate ABC transporter permease PstA n=1 Tax=Halorubrum distributum TaxID=29283 RepID=UPI002953629D|nr:phosphate ABC transporter permease PstA [Halorubrum distributum]MDV7350153.1 phosphate ABC transporter permease PstA [Halorubrum distributum]
MATENPNADGFGEVSRVRGIAFEYLSFGASVFGLVALGVLLVYVAIDAFDLANASPEWLLTYFLTLVVPFLAFCLYSANDRDVTRRALVALGGGLVAVATLFTAIETLVTPIPRLNWQLAYLFVVAAPVTAYVAYVGSSGRVGAVGFGLLGRLVGGAAIGLAVGTLFLVFDPLLWFLAYTIGVLPAVGLYALGRARSSPRARTAAAPAGLVGLVAAVVLRGVVATYPSDLIIYLWTIAVPVAAAGALLVADRRGRIAAAVVVGVPLAAATVGGFLAAGAGLPAATVLLVIVLTGVPTAVYVSRVVDAGEGLAGLGLPLLLAAGAIAGALVVEALGVPAPDPWLDASFLTQAPSRTPEQAGLYPAIVGSVIIIAMVAVLSFALGVGTSVFLEEYTPESGPLGTLTRILQVNIANLAAVPSVVYGLLGLGLFANLLGLGIGTAVTAALTLSLLILPITIISAQEAIRSVPDDLRRGSDAMGATRWQTTKNVVLPEAMPGILTGTILALGRAIGETAPLIMIGAATTVFRAPDSLFSRFSAMPMQIYTWAGFPQADFRYGVVAAGVITLLIILVGMNGTAILLRNRAERGS